MTDRHEPRTTTDRAGYALCHLEDVELGDEVFDYMERIEATFEPYDGRWVVHGVEPEVLEGRLTGAFVMIGFPTVTAARDWYESPAYQEILPLRSAHARCITVLLEGVPAGYRAATTVAAMRAAS